MRNDADGLDFNSGGDHSKGFFSIGSAPSGGRSIDAVEKTITVGAGGAVRTGSGQGLRFNPAVFRQPSLGLVRENHSYRILYEGIITPNSTVNTQAADDTTANRARLRLEGDNAVFGNNFVLGTSTALPIGAGEKPFSFAITVTHEDIINYGTNLISFGDERNGNATGRHFIITYTNIVITRLVPVEACQDCDKAPCECVETVIFDMRNDEAMNALVRVEGSNFDHPFLTSNLGTGHTVTITGTPNATIILNSRAGVGQAVRVKMSAINAIAKDGWSYRIEYSGTFAVQNAVPRMRMEGPATLFDGTAAVDGAFSHSVTFTRAEVTANAGNGLSLSCVDANSAITYTDIKIIAVPPVKD
jgi:hypothetical protein